MAREIIALAWAITELMAYACDRPNHKREALMLDPAMLGGLFRRRRPGRHQRRETRSLGQDGILPPLPRVGRCDERRFAGRELGRHLPVELENPVALHGLDAAIRRREASPAAAATATATLQHPAGRADPRP